MVPGGIAGHEGAGDDFTGVIIEGKDQSGVMFGGPPEMRRAVVLPEFADGPGLPATTGLGAAVGAGDPLGKMLTDIGGDGSAGTVEVQSAGQFVGQQGEVERLAMGQKVRQEIVRSFGPGFLVVTARGGELETGTVLKPSVAQLIKTSRTDHQPLGGGNGIEGAVVEGGQDFLGKERGNTVSELLFFIEANVAEGGAAPKPPKFIALRPRLRRVQR